MKFIPWPRKKFIWLVISISFLLVMLISWPIYRYQTSLELKPPLSDQKRNSLASPRLTIKDFAFNDYQGDRKILSIRADSLVVDRKKIGYFRVGLFNTAKLSEAIIDVYTAEGGLSSANDVNSGKTEKMGVPIDFGKTLSTNIFKGITNKNVIALEIAPIIIRIHDQQGLVLTIEGGYSKIGLKDDLIIFEKGVKVTADARLLSTNRLSFLLSRSLFRTTSPFVLKTPQKEWKGDYLEIDPYLDQVYVMDDGGQKKRRRER